LVAVFIIPWSPLKEGEINWAAIFFIYKLKSNYDDSGKDIRLFTAIKAIFFAEIVLSVLITLINW
jgi:uncharacterized membrane protein